MRYLVQATTLVSISLLFSACTPKVMIKKVYAPQILNTNTKDIAVDYISNDSVNLSQKLKTKLNNIYIDGVKYYNVYDDKTKANSILSGDINYNKVYEKEYYKKKTNYDYCLLFKGEKYEREYGVLINHRIKHPVCLKYDFDFIPCIEKQQDLQATLKLTNTQDSSIILLKTYNSSSNTKRCANNRYIDDNQNNKLAQDIADQFISDITPRYSYYKIDIIDDIDIKLTTQQKTKFEKAKDAIKNSNLTLAKNILEDLNKQTQNQSYTLLYNLALVSEALDDIYTANSLYKKASLLNIKTDNHLKLIYKGLNRTNEQIATKDALAPLIN